MERKMVGVVILGFALGLPVIAQQQPVKPAPVLMASAAPAKSPAKADAKAGKAETPEKPAAKENATVEVELLQLKELILEQTRELEATRAALRSQQEKIDALESRVAEKEAAPAASAEATAKPEEQNGQALKSLDNRVTQVETDFGAYKKANDSKVGRFGPFAFSGDARMRYEGFYGGGPATGLFPDRNRYRIRLRFNANAKFSDEFSGGFSLGTGDTNDPISTNATLTNGFTRKAFFIDRAFVKYDPKWFTPLSVTAGKFAYTWFRTELTWDNDLNPEGFSETLSWKFNNSPLERVTFVGFQSPVIEQAKAIDTFVYGGQVQTHWKLGDNVRLGGYLGFYNYQFADALRAARQAGTIGGSSNTNAASLTGTQYESKFGILDAIARVDVKTPWSRWPVMMLFDFAQNTRACENLVNIPVALQTPCNSHDRHGYWGELQLGRTQEQGDWNFGYTFIRLEREAVVDAFNFSDLRQPTNVFNHRFNLNYQARKNIQLGFTGLFGRPLVTAIPATTKENLLKRLQFDIVYKF